MSASLKANEPSMEEILASIRRIIADDTGKEPEPVAPPVEEEPEDDVLDLATVAKPTTVQDDDIEFREISEPLLVIPPELLKPEEPAPPPPVVEPPPPPPRVQAPPPPAPAPAESLLSASTNAAVTNAFNGLTSTILTQNARTLEDLVKDMMRPMLKSWLDDNLPALVERLVKAEIERVSRGPRG